MLWRMLRQSRGRNLRRKVLAIITVFLASSLISALLAVSIDIGDKMSRELKSYGANILIEPAGQAALPRCLVRAVIRFPVRIFLMKPSCRTSKISSGETTLSGLRRCSAAKPAWRENQCGFWALSSVSQWIFLMKRDMRRAENGQPILAGDRRLAAGTRRRRAADLVGQQLARQMGWKPGDKLTLRTEGEAVQVTVSGILSSGGDEDNQLVMPLSTVQHLLGLPGKVQAIRVSALTVPENELSCRARENPTRSMPKSTTSGIARPMCRRSRISWKRRFPVRKCARYGRSRRPKGW